MIIDLSTVEVFDSNELEFDKFSWLKEVILEPLRINLNMLIETTEIKRKIQRKRLVFSP